MSATPAPRRWRLWRAALLAAAGAIGVLYVAYTVRYFDFPITDRGWTIDHVVHNAWQAVRGEPVYVDPRLGSPTALLYGPGLTFLVAPLVALVGPELWTARLVNLLAVVILVAILTRETARRVRDRRLVWFAPALIVLTGASHGHELLVVHPDKWALAFSLLALLAARRAAETGRGLLWAVLASFAAVATKQTMVTYVIAAAAPLLAARRPARAALFLAGVAGLLAAGVAWGQHATGGQFLGYMLIGAQHRQDWDRLLRMPFYVAYFLGPTPLVPLAALIVGRWRPRLVELFRDPFLAALVLTVPATLTALMKVGATVNHLLALSLLLVPFILQSVDALLPWLAVRPRRAAAAAAACLLWAGWRVAADVPPLWARLAAHDQGVQGVRRLDEVIRSARGPVWVPIEISLAFRNGVPAVTPAMPLSEFSFDPQVFRPIVKRLEAGEFETIILCDDIYTLLPRDVFEPALSAHYRGVELVETDRAIHPRHSFFVILERQD